MADRASASMIIGGIISRSLLPALIEAIDLNNGRLDWEGEPVTASDVEEGKTLEIFACEIAGGMFDAVEALCEAHGVAFVRNSGSCVGVFGPERVIFDGSGPSRQYDLTESDQIALTITDFRSLRSIEAIAAWFQSAAYTPPPLTIVDDDPPCSSVT